MLQVRMPQHLRLGSEVSDEYAGDSHGASTVRWYGTVDETERAFCMSTSCPQNAKKQARTGVQRGNPVQGQKLGGGFSLAPLGQDGAAGDAGNPRQISLFLQAQKVVVRN